ncbi:MAG: PPC domain-containing DNA-binding protein [Candidatus Auribacterota bacterium]|jgi:predicted DNA-binding protein with PD1-like motif|uniref:DNA-binding protein n=1 Tax=Candidatus Auribacter fodinae TaxID=2093366 RepID=A0A3A4QXB3_9BACT|nr:MAG: DNA-binding protein [Candidatus Auribacter fodinae]
MEYSCGSIGRCFFVRLDHNEDILEELKKLAARENIRQAWICCLGAVKKAEIVTGPQETRIPPDPMWHSVFEGHELVGIGNITFKDDEPAIHLHGSFGRADKTRIGCLRKDAEVFLTVECMVIEFSGPEIKRAHNSDLDIDTLRFI